MNSHRPNAVSPLQGVKVAEQAKLVCDPSAVAVGFAGMLAASFGADVEIAELGASPAATSSFLRRGKSVVAETPTDEGRFLLSNDAALARKWRGPATVTIVAGRGPEKHSELTLQAESGLLDVYGQLGEPPLPLPGNQIAYAGGMVAFDALVAAINAAAAGRQPRHSTVSLVDVAKWINWKHYLAGHRNDANPGIGRIEEWETIRCADGYVTLVFQDKDLPALERLTGNPFFGSPDLRNRTSRHAHLTDFRQAIMSWAASKTRSEIVSSAQAARIPIGPVLAIDELPSDPQLRARSFFEPSTGLPRLPVLFGGRRVGGLGAEPDDSDRMDAAQ